MSVLSIKTFKAHPGQQEALLQLLHDARREMLRVDASRTVHIYEVVEGPQAGNVSSIIEYADMDALRVIRDKEQADPGWQAIGERANGPERPTETISSN